MQDTDTGEAYKWAPVFETKIRQTPGFEDVNSDLQLNNPQVTVEMNRDKLSTLGLSATQVENALYNAYGTRSGVADLRAEQSIPGDSARCAAVPTRSRRDVFALHPLEQRAIDSARVRGAPDGWVPSRSITTVSCRRSRSPSTWRPASRSAMR